MIISVYAKRKVYSSAALDLDPFDAYIVFFYSSGGNIRKYWWNIHGDLKAMTATSGGNLHLLVQLKSGVAINKSMQKAPKLL